MPDGNLLPKSDPGDQRTDLLDGWKEIGVHLRREVRTVQRWEKTLGLPIHRTPHDKQGRVFAYKSEIDVWWKTRDKPLEEDDSSSESTISVVTLPSPAASVRIPDNSSSSSKRFPRWLLWALGATILVIAVVALWPKAMQVVRPTKIVLSVVPFKGQTGDPEAQRIADGLTEEMISRLGHLHPARLMIRELPSTSPNTKLEQISSSSKDNGDYLLVGSVRRDGQHVAITAQLVSLREGTRVVWGNTYETQLKDVIDTEIQISETLISEVLNVLPTDQHQPPQLNRTANEAYLKGRYFWNRRTVESLNTAIAYFRQAIEADPTYAPPYAGLSDCYALLGSAPYSALPPKEAFPKAEEAALKALQLDETLAEAHVSLGYSRLVYDRNFTEAEKQFRRALQLRPGYATAHQYYAYYLTAVGRMEEAIQERKLAVQLDPVSPLLNSALGEAYYQAHQFDQTIELNKKSLELDPSYIVALVNGARAYEQKGMHAEAIAAYQKILTVAPATPSVMALLAHAYAVSGNPTQAQKILADLEKISQQRYVPSLYIAMIYTGLKDKDRAFQYLAKANDERCEYLVYLRTEPFADPLRSDPRFPVFLKSIGL
jgi:TolB-like protein/Flp pilus assembly protein TadD